MRYDDSLHPDGRGEQPLGLELLTQAAHPEAAENMAGKVVPPQL